MPFLGLPNQDGTLGPGRRADLVVVAANPFDGLATLRERLIVVAAGRVLDAEALEGLERELLERAGPRRQALALRAAARGRAPPGRQARA